MQNPLVADMAPVRLLYDRSTVSRKVRLSNALPTNEMFPYSTQMLFSVKGLGEKEYKNSERPDLITNVTITALDFY